MSKISKDLAKVLQKCLNERFNSGLVVDGDPGAKTVAAINSIVAIPNHWKKKRKLVGAVQYFCMMKDIEAGSLDGYWGPNTENAADQLEALVNTGSKKPAWRDDEGTGGLVSTSGAPLQTQSELVKYYGNVGENQTKVKVPYPLKLAWKTSTVVNRFTCHEKVADSISRVLTRVADHYGDDKIKALGLDLWGGCLNVRAMRGGTKYSTHSWGMAIDWHPAENRLRWDRTRATLARADYDVWWKLWEEEGWTSLGRARDYDWMHVQYARVK